jgi:adenylate cyclase
LLPVALFKFRPHIENFNLSQNVMLTYPVDFYADCYNLRVLTLKQNEMDMFPYALGQVVSLEELNMSQNNLKSVSFVRITSLENLSILNLECNLIEQFPEEFLSLKTLRDLNLSNNHIRALPTRIDALANLQNLNLSFNHLTTFPEALSTLPRLKKLIAVNNEISSLPSNFGKLTSLKFLDLRTNQLTDVTVVSGMHDLTDLLCDYNKINSFKDDIKLKSLETLSLNHNSLTLFSWKTTTNKIKYMNLTAGKLSNFISDDIFQSFLSLETLILDYNQLVTLPKSLVVCTALRYLSVHNNRLNEFPETIQSLSNLSYLDLHCNNIISLPKEIWYLKRLKVLNISSNLVSNLVHMPVLADSGNSESKLPIPNLSVPISHSTSNTSLQYKLPLCESLKELYIGENKLNEEALDAISCLHELEILNLSFNFISDIPQSILQLSKLKELSLSGNQISSLPDEFDKLRNLQAFYLDCNSFVTLPVVLSKMNHIKVFDASWNSLKYNITNYSFDWNWNWNTELRSLDLSGNHKLEIKATRQQPEGAGSSALTQPQKNLADFSSLTKLRILDISDIKVLPNPVPSEGHEFRVRYGCHDIEPLIYGVAQSLDRNDMNCRVWDMGKNFKCFLMQHIIGLMEIITIIFGDSLQGETGKDLPSTCTTLSLSLLEHL